METENCSDHKLKSLSLVSTISPQRSLSPLLLSSPQSLSLLSGTSTSLSLAATECIAQQYCQLNVGEAEQFAPTYERIETGNKYNLDSGKLPSDNRTINTSDQPQISSNQQVNFSNQSRVSKHQKYLKKVCVEQLSHGENFLGEGAHSSGSTINNDTAISNLEVTFHYIVLGLS